MSKDTITVDLPIEAEGDDQSAMTTGAYIEITDETHPDHPELQRVKALRDMPVFGVRAGDLGGWVHVSDRLYLAVNGRAWVGRNARVWGGTIWGGTILGGSIYGGTIWGGTIQGGTIYSGTIWDGTLWDGTIRGGTVRGGVIEGGTVYGGIIQGGTILGGSIYGGTIWGGTIQGGTIYSGTIQGGTIRGGSVHGSEVLYLTGLPSGDLTCHRIDGGWAVHVGCWTGTPDELQELIAQDEGWPEARGEEIARRRPLLEAALGLIDAHIARVAADAEGKV